MTQEQDYQFWTDMLAGKSMAVHEGDPQCGFYRVKNGEKWVMASGRIARAVAIWRADNGEMVGLIGTDGKNMKPAMKNPPAENKGVADLDAIWLACCMTPITHEQYISVVDNGELWPDELTAQPKAEAQPKGTPMPTSASQVQEPGIGHNQPPPDEVEVDSVTAAITAADAELKKPGEDKVYFDRLANHRDRLSKLWSELEGKRKVEKQPHLKAAADVDAKYAPDLDRIKLVGEALKAAITKFLLAEKARIEKEEKEAALQPAQAGTPIEQPKKAEAPKVGTTGRKAALRTFTSAKIIDYEKLLLAVANKPEVVQVVQTLADRAARAGFPLEGTEILTEERAV